MTRTDFESHLNVGSLVKLENHIGLYRLVSFNGNGATFSGVSAPHFSTVRPLSDVVGAEIFITCPKDERVR